MKSGVTAAILAAFISVVSPVQAQDILDAPLGTTFQTTAKFGPRQIPLPPGEWTLFVREVSRSPATANAAAIPTLRAFLTQTRDGKLDRWIFAHTNTQATAGGWVRDVGVCDRNDVHYAVADSNYNSRDTECWIVNHVIMTLGNNPSPILRDFYERTADRGRPATALMTRYFLVKESNLLDIAYFSNPENAGFERSEVDWRGSPWHRDRAVQDPKKVAYVAKLKQEGEMLLPQLKRGLYGRQ